MITGFQILILIFNNFKRQRAIQVSIGAFSLCYRFFLFLFFFFS